MIDFVLPTYTYSEDWALAELVGEVPRQNCELSFALVSRYIRRRPERRPVFNANQLRTSRVRSRLNVASAMDYCQPRLPAPMRDFLQQLQADLPCPASAAKIIRFAADPKSPLQLPPSRPEKRGVGHRHERWGGLRWTRQRQAREVFAGRFSVSEHGAQTNGA